MYGGDVKKADAKDDKILMRHLVDNLPNDQMLDEFEHTEGTYKDYSRMTCDSLSEAELKLAKKGEIYRPADEDKHLPMTFAQAVEQAVARRKGDLSVAVEKWPTDDELDKQEANEHFTVKSCNC